MYCIIKKGQCHLSHEQFRIALAKELLSSASHSLSQAAHGPRHQPLQPPARLSERHFLAHIEKTASGHQWQKNCAVCSQGGDAK